MKTPSSGRLTLNAMPPLNLTLVFCHQLHHEMLRACRDASVRHGLVAEAQDITRVSLRRGFDAAFCVSIPLPDSTALNPERLRFEVLAEAFGLLPADYDCQFSTGRELFRIAGIAPRRPSIPFRPNASRTGRASSSPPTRWPCCCSRG
jgi:hypothetical protein